MRAEIDQLYSCTCKRCSTLKAELKANISDVENIFKEIDNLKNSSKSKAEKRDKISTKLFAHTIQHLQDSLDGTFHIPFGEKNYSLYRSYVKNLTDFSAFKTAYFTELLKKEDNRDALIATYERQLATEGNLVTRSARSAKQWLEYENTKDLFPNLEYRPSRSADKREEHKALYGIIKPIDDEFWHTYYPPNGWGCKCRTRKTDEPITEGATPKVTVPNGIPGNIVKQRAIFTNSHPLIAKGSNIGKKRIQKRLEELKRYVPYSSKPDYEGKAGGKVYVHPYFQRKDVKDNFEVAKLLTDNFDMEIKIREHVNGYTGIGKYKNSNPEYLINGKYGDLKDVNKENISNGYDSAVHQGCEVVVYRILSNLTIGRAIDQLKGIKKKRKTFLKCYIIKGNEIVRV